MRSRKITPIPYQKLVKVFELDGFTVKRHKGDHLILTRPGVKRPLVIKTSPPQAPVTHILTNLRTAGMTRERSIDCRPFFYPLNSLPAYGNLAQAEQARRRNQVSYKTSPYAVNLPCSLNITQEQIRYVGGVLRSILHSARPEMGTQTGV